MSIRRIESLRSPSRSKNSCKVWPDLPGADQMTLPVSWSATLVKKRIPRAGSRSPLKEYLHVGGGATPRLPNRRFLSVFAESVVLYDADCGFCRWMVAQVLRWDRRGRLATRPIQDRVSQQLLQSVPGIDRLDSWHLVEDNGCLYSGGAVFVPLLEVLPGGEPFAHIARWFPSLAESGYRFVARNRSVLSQAVPRRAKAVADRQIQRREQRTIGTELPSSTRRC